MVNKCELNKISFICLANIKYPVDAPIFLKLYHVVYADFTVCKYT